MPYSHKTLKIWSTVSKLDYEYNLRYMFFLLLTCSNPWTRKPFHTLGLLWGWLFRTPLIFGYILKLKYLLYSLGKRVDI